MGFLNYKVYHRGTLIIMIVLVHTPKCGGKSIYKSLLETYGNRLLLDQTDPFVLNFYQRFYQRFYSTIYKNQGKIAGKYDCIFGHFPHDRYRAFQYSQNNMLGMLFRDPIDLVSSYYFYKTNKGKLEAAKHGLEYSAEYPYRSVLELSSTYKFKNFFKLYLGRLSIEDLGLLFIQEDFSKSCLLFNKVTGVKVEEYKENITQKKPKNYKDFLANNNQLSEVMGNMSSNIKIYHHALERFNSLCQKYGID